MNALGQFRLNLLNYPKFYAATLSKYFNENTQFHNFLITAPHCAVNDAYSDGLRDPYSETIAIELTNWCKQNNIPVTPIYAKKHRILGDKIDAMVYTRLMT